MGETANNEARLLSLRIRDQRGFESDSVEIELNDSDGKIQKPSKGAELQIYLGYDAQPLHFKGVFIVDEVSHSGPPDKLTISAKAADMLQSMKSHKTRSWDNVSLGSIVQTIAAEHGLQEGISAEFSAVQIEHIDQTNESDLHFLTRLAKNHDAIMKPAAGTLLFVKKGASSSVSGVALPLVTIARSDTNQHHFTEKGHDEFTGVTAHWHNMGTANREAVTIGNTQKIKSLATPYTNASEARQAAQAEFDRLQRDGSTLELSLMHGKPELIAEISIQPLGFRSYIDVPWVATEVEHELSAGGGLSTQIQCELPQNS